MFLSNTKGHLAPNVDMAGMAKQTSVYSSAPNQNHNQMAVDQQMVQQSFGLVDDKQMYLRGQGGSSVAPH